MAITTYSTNAGRINTFKGEVLAHAMYHEVLGLTGQNLKIPKNVGDNAIYRRVLPYGATSTNANTMNRPIVTASSHVTSEGVTPATDQLVTVDVTVVLQQYAVLYGFTDKMADMHEDDIPKWMKEQTGERTGLLREMIKWGALKGGTNIYYAGGTTRVTVDEVISYNLLSKIARNLQANHAKQVTKILAPSSNFNTAPVEAGYLVFGHTDLEHDIRALPDFIKVAEYGQRKPIHAQELGSVGRFRFVLSAELGAIADSGAAVSGLGLYSTTGTDADVYPVIIVGEDAWGDVALRGSASFDPTWIPTGTKSGADPLGQRGYVGGKFYSAAVILNNGWMAVAECAITAL